MKIKLPHRTVIFKEEDKFLSGKEKSELVEKILQEKLIVNNEEMVLENYFRDNFNNQSVIVALDMFTYFITKEHKVKEEIMTRETIKKMQRGDGRTINFSNLAYNDNLKMGLVDDSTESNYN